MSTSLLSPLSAYLEKNTRAFGLSVDKVLKRAEKIQVDDNGIVSFEMERHSGVGGSRSEQGFKMSAMITRRYLYSFNPSNDELTEESIGEPSWDDTSWDWDDLAADNMEYAVEFSFEETAPSSFEFRDSASGFTAQVSSPEEAITAFSNVLNGWDFSSSFEELEGIDTETKGLLCDRLKQACLEYATKPITEAWEYRELLEDDEY
ncbi:hypothetical protein [Neptuniibacter sp. QD48_11]|uniref:hypothetical protein n=1 Tax=Neptuniibacter sp. QD48_11 TaxID=3398211 RepID=UPI0039F636BA